MRKRQAVAVILAAGSLTACGSASPPPTAPSTEVVQTVPTGPATPSPVTPGSSTFSIDLPIQPGDTANNAYGLWPFGTHGGGHALDGHPGWDVEYRPGANVLSAADGTVLHAMPEASGGRFTVRISHSVDGRTAYATDYTNLGALAAGIASGAKVERGQMIGPAGIQTQIIGTTAVTWAMTHFQMNDFSRNEGLTNPNAVSAEAFLSPAGRAVFDVIWAQAAYQTEWCEPFASNSRSAGFPMARTWTLQSGELAPTLEVRCPSESSNEYTYALLALDRSPIESGTFVSDPVKKPLATVDFRPSSSAARLGVWNIVSNTLQLNLAAPGAARPSSLDGAASYSTK
ncbi:MAG TPA: M23 family metallopeptidase [Vicinamibacterales bacterium]|nr:M23 family metallopeptidase [Vicinamibacterales bacterium]